MITALARMQDDCLAKCMLFATGLGTLDHPIQPRIGGAVKKWWGCVASDLQLLGVAHTHHLDWYPKALDREGWRKLVNSIKKPV